MIVAAVPTRILRKWDRIAATQLCEAASKQAEEMDRLRSDIAHADSLLDFWHDQALSMQLQLCEEHGTRPGITQAGQLVEARP